MKKILLALGLTIISASASAQMHQQHGLHYRPHYYNYNWVTPMVIGGVVGYGIYRWTQPVQPVIVQPYPVYTPVPAPPPVQPANCGPWVEIQNADGTVTRQRTCNQ